MCQFNAGVDINHFEQVTFEELITNNTAFYKKRYSKEEQELLTQTTEKIMR